MKESNLDFRKMGQDQSGRNQGQGDQLGESVQLGRRVLS